MSESEFSKKWPFNLVTLHKLKTNHSWLQESQFLEGESCEWPTRPPKSLHHSDLSYSVYHCSRGRIQEVTIRSVQTGWTRSVLSYICCWYFAFSQLCVSDLLKLFLCPWWELRCSHDEQSQRGDSKQTSSKNWLGLLFFLSSIVTRWILKNV